MCVWCEVLWAKSFATARTRVGLTPYSHPLPIASALAWVQKSRKKEEEKKLAEKQAKMFEEMDDEFGISDLVESSAKEEEDKKKQVRCRTLFLPLTKG